MKVTVFWICVLNSIDFFDLISPFSPHSLSVLVSNEKIDHTLKTVLDRISKHLEICEKYCAAHRIQLLFSSFIFDISHKILIFEQYVFLQHPHLL